MGGGTWSGGGAGGGEGVGRQGRAHDLQYYRVPGDDGCVQLYKVTDTMNFSLPWWIRLGRRVAAALPPRCRRAADETQKIGGVDQRLLTAATRTPESPVATQAPWPSRAPESVCIRAGAVEQLELMFPSHP